MTQTASSDRAAARLSMLPSSIRRLVVAVLMVHGASLALLISLYSVAGGTETWAGFTDFALAVPFHGLVLLPIALILGALHGLAVEFAPLSLRGYDRRVSAAVAATIWAPVALLMSRGGVLTTWLLAFIPVFGLCGWLIAARARTSAPPRAWEVWTSRVLAGISLVSLSGGVLYVLASWMGLAAG